MKQALLELVRRTSAELPRDVAEALERGLRRETRGTTARTAMEVIRENNRLAHERSLPICQDTGSLLFFVGYPRGFDTQEFQRHACAAVAEATKRGFLRQNSVDPISGRNTGTNLGPGSPSFHFHQHKGKSLDVRLMLKGGGSENMSVQYSLPDTGLGAGRDLAGVHRCLLDAVQRAQGKGCAPGILAVCVGGDRATGFLESKEQLLRRLDDTNPDPQIARIERTVLRQANDSGIGPMGFGGKTTLLGVKIGMRNRVPASYFVSVAYMCWAFRRQGVLVTPAGRITKWLY